jgi:hypothetical protein
MVAETEGVLTLQRLIITFKPEETIMHALYRTQDGPNGAKTRRREVTKLAREGLSVALKALEQRVDLVGVSGYHVREDIVLCSAKDDARRDEHKTVRKGA